MISWLIRNFTIEDNLGKRFDWQTVSFLIVSVIFTSVLAIQTIEGLARIIARIIKTIT